MKTITLKTKLIILTVLLLFSCKNTFDIDTPKCCQVTETYYSPFNGGQVWGDMEYCTEDLTEYTCLSLSNVSKAATETPPIGVAVDWSSTHSCNYYGYDTEIDHPQYIGLYTEGYIDSSYVEWMTKCYQETLTGITPC